MARSTTTKRKLASGLTWRGNTIWIDTFVDGERLRQSCKTNSPAEARKLLDTVKGQRRWAALTGKVPEHLQTKVPLQGFVDDVLREMEVDRFAPRTLARYRYIMRVFVAFCQDELGREPQLKDITDDLLRSYKLHAASTHPAPAMATRRAPSACLAIARSVMSSTASASSPARQLIGAS